MKTAEIASRGAVEALVPRWFVMRDVHAGQGALLVQPRHALSWMKGPLTASELRRRCATGGIARGPQRVVQPERIA